MAGKSYLKSKLAISLLMVVLTFSATAQAKIIYVDADADGANNGSSWTDAFNYLQDALNAAVAADEIQVAQGTYKPDQGTGITPGDRTATFQLINGVTIKGGFAGLGELDPDVRDVELYESTLSGDLNGDDDIVGMNDNSRCVVYVYGPVGFSTVLDGLTVTAGFVTASGLGGSAGGAGLTIAGNPTITIVNCTFAGNYAIGYGESSVDGAAIVAYYASPVISNCTFRDNHVESKERIACGAGLWCYHGAPVVTDCEFIENTAIGNYPSGAGIWTYEGNTTVSNCTFLNNHVEGFFAQGAGLMNLLGDIVVTDCKFIENTAVSHNSEGAGLWNNFGDAVVTACEFIKNSADYGGGMFNAKGSSTVTYCIFTDNSADKGGGIWNYEGNPTVRNCLFAGNGSKQGGALWNYEGSPNIVNCTITSNTATQKGGAIWNWEGAPTIGNTIMWLNIDQDGTTEESQIYNYSGSPLISHSWIAKDPLFLDPENADYHLNHNSPCINAGDPNYLAEPNETDLDGNPRVINGRIDMGAYESRYPRIIYVDDDAAGANDGSSWADAYNYLQDALTAAWRGDEIRVAQGIYKPDQGAGITPGDREATFQLINGVTLKGGYAGEGAPDPNTRDIELYETILTGDLAGNDLEDVDPDELLEHPNRAENSYHVLTVSNTDVNVVLDGFTIASGNVNRESLSPYKSGGGMYIDQGNLAISNCNFNNNSAWYAGGGIYIRAGSAVLTNCIFSANSSLHGGGLRNFGSLTLTNCVFTGNWAAEGGGMENRGIMTLTNCTFSENSARYSGGGMENHTWRGRPMLYNCMFNDNIGSWGGGMHNYYCSTAPKLINCSFKNNLAETGGGMCNLSSSPILVNCTFTYNSAFEGGGMSNLCGDEGPSEPVITKCAFIRNFAKDFGGGMFSSVGFQTLTNCIFSENLAEYGSGILVSQSVLTLISCTFGENSADDNGTLCSWYGNSELRLSNCILWDDDNEIYNRDDSTINITYSNVQGGWPGEGNIDADPHFVEPGYWDSDYVWIEGDYHLLPDSPCLDAGDPNYIAGPNETDLDGRPRVMGGRIDMGAYEFQSRLILYVDTDATGANDGSSWDEAFNFLQDALAAAYNGNEIRVAQGIYKPDQGAGITPGDRTATFQLINGVTLKGGYAGFDSKEPNARDIELYETILTGDLNGDDGPRFVNNVENSYHVVTGSHTDATTVLDGFTVTGGNAAMAHPGNRGGGMYIYYGFPKVTDCTFSGNSSNWAGGGLANDGGSTTLTNCTFSGNSSWAGGGMNSWGSPTLTNCTFIGNSAGCCGGGMYTSGSTTLVNCVFSGNTADVGAGICNDEANMTLTNCAFIGNSAASVGGGMYNSQVELTLTNCTFSGNAANNQGGGMFNDKSSPKLISCTFSGNSAGSGGGMSNQRYSDTVLINCKFYENLAKSGGGGIANSGSHPTLTNCIISRNSSSNWYGGGMYHDGGWDGPTLINCIISENSAKRGGGLYFIDTYPALITNCIFIGNSANYGGGIFNDETRGTFTNCIFIGNLAYEDGGGMRSDWGSYITLANCVISHNLAGGYGGGMYNKSYGSQDLTNCILWGNEDCSGTGESAQIRIGSPTTIYYTCIQGWTGNLGGIGNIDDDPCFANPGYLDANGVWIDGDYHLMEDSPCIDAGDPNYVAEPNETDLDGNPRVINGRIDMGAYESPIFAQARILPRTINLASKGKSITCYIRLPEGYNVADIEPNSIFLMCEIEPKQFTIDEQQQVATAKFTREDVQPILEVGDVELTITGQLMDGTFFTATDKIKVIERGGKK